MKEIVKFWEIERTNEKQFYTQKQKQGNKMKKQKKNERKISIILSVFLLLLLEGS